jgi:non-specific serine/threonine protein kinase
VKERPADVPGASVELNQLLADVLEKEPERRPPSADALYERLQPFAVGLRMLPGFLAPTGNPSPGRMYARVVGRVLGD